MARPDNYEVALQRAEAGRISEIEVGRAQVHATLALADILRDVVAELTAIRQAVQR
jgi:hypothetical protein